MFIIIGGATGTGKSAVAVELASLIKGEIVSADSMQVYRSMDIGTYKTPINERKGITHHLIDIIGPGEGFSAAMFKARAEAAMDDIKKRKKVPIVAGGTGLYINSIIKGIMKAEEPDETLKKRLRQELDKKGLKYLSDELIKKDPEAAVITDLKNSRRVIRALELMEANGEKLTDLKKRTSETAYKDEYRFFITSVERESLYKSLDARVDAMVSSGLFDEVKAVLSAGVKKDSTSLQAIGYKEAVEYLEGKCAINDAVKNIKQATRNYAKRQVTWFKKYKDAVTLDMGKMTVKQAAEYIFRNIPF